MDSETSHLGGVSPRGPDGDGKKPSNHQSPNTHHHNNSKANQKQRPAPQSQSSCAATGSPSAAINHTDNHNNAKSPNGKLATPIINDPELDRVDPAEFELRKRMPPHFSRKRNDVYVTRRTDAKAQLARCEKIFDKAGYSELSIHGFGQAINRALNLGLILKRRGLGSIDLDINTSTVQVTDDIMPLFDEGRPGQQQRFISAVHIRVFHPETPVTEY